MHRLLTRYSKYIPRHLLTAGLLCVAGVSQATFIHAAIAASPHQSKVDDSHYTPIKLARWHRGASLVLTQGADFQRVTMSTIANYEASILLSSNSALSYKIQSGTHDFIIDLGSPLPVSRFYQNNQSAGGALSLLASNTLEAVDSEQWMPLSKSVSFTSGVIPSVSFPESTTRYILIRFDIKSEGSIGNISATGSLSRTQASIFEAAPVKAN